MANCMATKIYLQLRNKTFYYRVELPRVNNKRRYKIISLHTQNYFEAQEKIKQMMAEEEKLRRLSPFFMDIKVKTGNNDGFDFHSFRKNLSIALQDSGVGATYINDIIGWEGKTTMEQSYSNHTLAQIKAEMHKFSYNFLKPHFAKWKTIMAKK